MCTSFLNENKTLVKIYTMINFVAGKVPRRTIYAILERSEHFLGQRANEGGQKLKKCAKGKLTSFKSHLITRTTTLSVKRPKFGVSQPMIEKVHPKKTFDITEH